METFKDLIQICEDLQEKHNFLLNCYRSQKQNDVVDPEIIDELSEMIIARNKAAEILKKYKERW